MAENMILINWNVEWASPKTRKIRRTEILNRIQQHDPELVCLTEAHPNLLDGKGYHPISSGRDYGLKTSKGCKVMLWSKKPWRDEHSDIGSKDKDFPPGRFIRGVTQTSIGDLLIVSICIPYLQARTGTGAVIRRKYAQDHENYLLALKPLITKLIEGKKPFVLVGDFNQRIDGDIHYAPVALRGLLRFALGSLTIPTSATKFNFNGRPSIDHICLHRLKSKSVRPIDNYHESERLSDHFGIVVDLCKNSRVQT